MGKGYDRNNAMAIEKKSKKTKKMNLKSKKIKKIKRTQRNASNLPDSTTGMEVENKKKSLISKKEIIKQMLKKKKKIKANPRLFKDFNNKVEKESQNLLLSGKLSKGQKKRLKRKMHFLKKKNFGNYIEGETNPEKKKQNEIKNIFNMNSLDKNLESIELDIQAEMLKFNNTKDHKTGIKSRNTNKVTNNEIRHMDKVMNHPAFQNDPFAAIKTHLLNSLDE